MWDQTSVSAGTPTFTSQGETGWPAAAGAPSASGLNGQFTGKMATMRVSWMTRLCPKSRCASKRDSLRWHRRLRPGQLLLPHGVIQKSKTGILEIRLHWEASRNSVILLDISLIKSTNPGNSKSLRSSAFQSTWLSMPLLKAGCLLHTLLSESGASNGSAGEYTCRRIDFSRKGVLEANRGRFRPPWLYWSILTGHTLARLGQELSVSQAPRECDAKSQKLICSWG